MVGNNAIQVVVATFRDETGADKALGEVQAIAWQGLIMVDNAAALRRDQGGNVHFKELGDMHGDTGAVIGGVTGAVLGILTGPIGWSVGLGALVGGLAAKLRDAGFPDARLRELGERLTPGTSALVAVVELDSVRDLRQELEKYGADVITEGLSKGLASQLEAGRDVAYAALVAAGTILAEQDVSGTDHGETDQLIAANIGGEVEKSRGETTDASPASRVAPGEQGPPDPPHGQPPATTH